MNNLQYKQYSTANLKTSKCEQKLRRPTLSYFYNVEPVDRWEPLNGEMCIRDRYLYLVLTRIHSHKDNMYKHRNMFPVSQIRCGQAEKNTPYHKHILNVDRCFNKQICSCFTLFKTIVTVSISELFIYTIKNKYRGCICKYLYIGFKVLVTIQTII